MSESPGERNWDESDRMLRLRNRFSQRGMILNRRMHGKRKGYQEKIRKQRHGVTLPEQFLSGGATRGWKGYNYHTSPAGHERGTAAYEKWIEDDFKQLAAAHLKGE